MLPEADRTASNCMSENRILSFGASFVRRYGPRAEAFATETAQSEV